MAGSMVTLRDITEKRKVEEELRRAHEMSEARVSERNSELDETNRALERENADRMTGRVVHWREVGKCWTTSSMPLRRPSSITSMEGLPGSIEPWLRCLENSTYEGRRPEDFYALGGQEYERCSVALQSEPFTNADVVETEAEFKRSDGSVFFGSIRLSALDPDHPGKGNIGIIVRSLRDNKRAELERRETEERYQARLVEDSFDGILIHNGRSDHLLPTPASMKCWTTRHGELVGMEYWRVFHPDGMGDDTGTGDGIG